MNVLTASYNIDEIEVVCTLLEPQHRSRPSLVVTLNLTDPSQVRQRELYLPFQCNFQFLRRRTLKSADPVPNSYHMSYVSPCPEDMKAIRAAFDRDDFELLNILANRLLANSVYQPEDQKRFLMAGFFAKDLAIELLRVSSGGKTAAIATAKAKATPFLTHVFSLASGKDFDFEEFWKIYTEYAERLRKTSMGEIEELAYSENRGFTRKATDWLLQYLHEQKDLLLDSRNNLLEGILNEAGRIYRVHGAELRELKAFALLDYLQKIYAYVKQGFKRTDGSLEPNVVQSEIHPLVDRILSLFNKPLGTSVLEDVDDLLLELLLKWRHYFIRYMDLTLPRGVAPEKGIELPEETKQRITEAITKTLDRETRK